MALHQPAHHVGLARRAERRADFLGLLHRDQAIDDVAARHQQAWTCSSMASISLRSSCSEGGAGGGCDICET